MNVEVTYFYFKIDANFKVRFGRFFSSLILYRAAILLYSIRSGGAKIHIKVGPQFWKISPSSEWLKNALNW